VTAGGGGVPLLEVATDTPQQQQTHHHQRQRQQKHGILHACVCCRVPVPSLVEIALLLFPEQAYQRDVRHGMIPLHHALWAGHGCSHATPGLLTILLKGTTPLVAAAAAAAAADSNGDTARTVSASEGCLSPTSATTTTKTKFTSTKTDDGVANDNDRESSSRGSKACIVPSPEYLRSTVLVPFPSENNNERNNAGAKQNRKQERKGTGTGPIPLSRAIKLGLSMETVIHQLLEADSHDSLRTVDPATQLPPFALVATRVPRHSAVTGYLIDCSRGCVPQTAATSPPTTTTTSMIATRKEPRPNDFDVVAAAIESTLHALSSGDSRSPLLLATTAAGNLNGTQHTARNAAAPALAESTAPYKLDDVYRLLLWHPQVLAQYTPRR